MNRKLSKYVEELDKKLIDSEIKKSIMDSINFYLSHGKLYIDGDNLYGTYINTKDGTRANHAKEFLEIKIDGFEIICNYSEWSNRRLVNVIQNTLKGGNTKIYRKYTDKIATFNNQNMFDIKEEEYIYNYQGRLIYDYEMRKSKDYDTGAYDKSGIIYNGGFWNNYLLLEKNWYIENGSIIKYELSKHFMDDDSKLKEEYSICIQPVKTEFDGTIYNFLKLDEEVFIALMNGKLDICDVINEVEGQKKINIYNKTVLD